MTDATENIILEMLKGLRNEVRTMRSEMTAEFKDAKLRMTAVEHAIAGTKRDAADQYEDHVRQQAAMDIMSDRLTRIENQLAHTPQ